MVKTEQHNKLSNSSYKSGLINIGKIPPQALDMEEAVLGALMIDERGSFEIMEFMFKDAFYKDAHQQIFESIHNLFKNNEPIDLLTVSKNLKSKGKLESIGGDMALVQLTQKVSSSAHIEFHSRIILQKYIQRSLIRVSNESIENAYKEDADVFDLLDQTYDNLNSVTESAIKKTESSFGETVIAQIEKGRKIYKGEIKPGLETPFKKLTRRTGGFRDEELIILAARPGMGKTSFALTIALHAAENKTPVCIFSLEMSSAKLIDRILSMKARIPGDKFNVHGLSDQDLNVLEPISKDFQKMPIHIDDTSSLSIDELQIKAKILKRKHNIGLLVVDYLQLMTASIGSKGGNREQEISKISRGLKKISGDLKIPVIALSQLSRAVETRGGNKRPQLSDLRESGAIEQDADMVMFLYRPEYYNIDQWDEYNNVPTQGECEYIVAKNRNGGLVRNRVGFEAKYTLFSDLEEQEPDLVPVSAAEAFDLPEHDNDDLPF